MPAKLVARSSGTVNRLERDNGRQIVRVEANPRRGRDVSIRANAEATPAERIEAAAWMTSEYGGDVAAWYEKLWHEKW